MKTPTKASETDILKAVAQAVWKKMGRDKSNLPEVTPDKLRQWMPQISKDELMPFHGRHFANCAEIPKDDESGNWIEIAWYRLVRCQQQHADDVPIKTDEVTTSMKLFPDGPNSEALVTKTVITNEDEIEPRPITNMAMMGILEGWDNDSKMAYFHEDEVSGKQILEMVNTEVLGMNNLEDGIIAIHRLWSIVNDEYKGQFYHPLEPIIEAYLQETTAKHITQEYDQKHTVAILQRDTMGSIRNMPDWISRGEDIGQLRISTPAPKIGQIPLFETESVLPAVLPIEYIRLVEGTHSTKCGNVAMPIRLFFEAVMALEPKETRADIHFKLGDLLQYLNPDGKYNRTNHLAHVLRGLHSLFYLRIPYRSDPDKSPTEVDWIPVLPRTVPSEKSGNDASIILEVRLPPDAAGGMLVEKEILRLTGKKSSAKFNAYLTACWIFDKYGTYNGGIIDPTKPAERRDENGYLKTEDGQRIYGKRGNPIKDPYHKKARAILDRVDNEARDHYPTLSFDDLTRACYPAGFDRRKQATYQKRAFEAWEGLDTDGIVRIERLSQGWRIMPSESHIRRYRALRRK